MYDHALKVINIDKYNQFDASYASTILTPAEAEKKRDEPRGSSRPVVQIQLTT